VKVTLERLPESRVQLEIEVEPDRLERSLDAAYKRLVPTLRIPGFRPGKAPRRIVEQMVGRERLLHEALDALVPAAYSEAIESEDVEPVADPDLEILETEPVRFKVTVPVRPTVTLGDYHSIRIAPEPVEVTDEMFEEQMEMIRRRFATIAPVERGAEWNDILTADIKGIVDDTPFVEDEDVEFPLREGQPLLLPDLAEEFLGMEAESEKTVELPVPEDFPEQFANKTASLTLTVKSVKEEELPDEDDDLAQQVNAEEFETIDDLHARVRDDLQETLQRQADEAYRLKVVDELVGLSEIEYPQVLLDREIDGLIRESHGSDVRAYQAHLAQIGKTTDEFREMYREPALERLSRSLVLGELTTAESIEITDDDVAEQVEKMLEPLGEQAESMRTMFESDQGSASIRNSLLTDKTLARLQEIASADAEEEETE
jgi:trigger factor